MKKVLSFLVALQITLSSGFFGLYQPTAAAAEPGEIMFLLDASSSMLIKDGTSTRIDKAKAALSSTLSSLPADTKVGLRIYGSQVPDTDEVKGCSDTQLISKPTANNASSLKTAVANVQAKGWTLMGKSLQDIQGDFQGNGSKTVILISDGIDTCTPPDACEVAKSLSALGSKIKVNTVGLVVSGEARNQLSCIASNSGGDYYDINKIDRLQETLVALAMREVTLFTTNGIPIEGTVRREDAPFMLANTSYTDTLVVPQELYFGFDALPEQVVNINIKAGNPANQFGATDYMRVGGYNLDTGETLAATGIIGSSQRFSKSQGSVEFNYKVDTKRQKLDKPSRLGFKIYLSTNANKFDGQSIALEMKITTIGGKSVDYKTGANTNGKNASAESKKPWAAIIVAILIVLALLAATYVYLKKRGKIGR